MILVSDRLISVISKRERERDEWQALVVAPWRDRLCASRVNRGKKKEADWPRNNNYSPNARPAISISLAHFSLMLMGILFKRAYERRAAPSLFPPSRVSLSRVLLPRVARFGRFAPSVARNATTYLSLPRFVYDDAPQEEA
jgi:hypothetical protein